LARRGPSSFSFYSRRSLDEAVKAVREAIEASGRTPRVDVVKSRSDHPPRIVTAEGIQARFRIEVTRHPAGAEGGLEWTEVVDSEDHARDLCGRVDLLDLHAQGLHDVGLQHVKRLTARDIDPHRLPALLPVGGPKFDQDIDRVEARILAERPGNDLERACER